MGATGIATVLQADRITNARVWAVWPPRSNEQQRGSGVARVSGRGIRPLRKHPASRPPLVRTKAISTDTAAAAASGTGRTANGHEPNMGWHCAAAFQPTHRSSTGVAPCKAAHQHTGDA